MPHGHDIRAIVKRTVLDVAPDAEIILYGSRARGDHQPDSDWDFLVLCDNGEDREVKDAIRSALYQVELSLCQDLALGEVIMAITHSREYWDSAKIRATPFNREVRKDGVSI